MHTKHLSPSAYVLRLQWEKSEPKRFKKFKSDSDSLQVINALAEMIAGTNIRSTFDC